VFTQRNTLVRYPFFKSKLGRLPPWTGRNGPRTAYAKLGQFSHWRAILVRIGPWDSAALPLRGFYLIVRKPLYC
jgi:hypothetical protein